MTNELNPVALDDSDLAAIADIKLSIQEQSLIVRLATERTSQELYAFDQGAKARFLNSLVEKGLAVTIEGGWKLTRRGQIRCTSIY